MGVCIDASKIEIFVAIACKYKLIFSRYIVKVSFPVIKYKDVVFVCSGQPVALTCSNIPNKYRRRTSQPFVVEVYQILLINEILVTLLSARS